MENIFVCVFNGVKYWKIGRMTSRLTPSYVKCHQHHMSLFDKWLFGFKGRTRYTIYDCI